MVTVNMVVHWLRPVVREIRHGFFSQRTFDWVALPGVATLADEEERTLLITQDARLVEGLEAEVPVILLARDISRIDADLRRRDTLIVETELTATELLFYLQGHIRRIEAWDHELEVISADHGTYQQMLEASEAILENMITMTDSTYRLIAHTPHMAVDDPVTMKLIEDGHHSEATIRCFSALRLFSEWTKQRKVHYTEHGVAAHPVMNYVFSRNGAYLFNIVMTCTNVPYSPGLEDMFGILISHIRDHIARTSSWDDSARMRDRGLFTELLEGKLLSKRLIAEQMKVLGITGDESVRLYAIRERANRCENLKYVTAELGEALPGCFVVAVGHLVYVVALSASGTGAWDDLEHALLAITGEFSVDIAASGPLRSLSDLKVGAMQADIAFRYGLIRARQITDMSESGDPIYRFENSLFDYLLFNGQHDVEFLRYCYETSCLHRMEKGRGRPSSDFDILRFYLKHESSPKLTAQALGIHRNTVLNRINQIMDREGLDLSDAKVRINLIALYHLSDLLELGESALVS